MFSCARRTMSPISRGVRRAPRAMIHGIAVNKTLWRFLIVGPAVLACACSSTSLAGASLRNHSNATPSFPVTVTSANGRTTIASRPDRIISLSPTATEMLYAIGAGRQVVAVDSDSDYPQIAPRTKLSFLNPNVEAIAKYRPDLVIVYYNANGLIHSLTSLRIPVLLEPAASTLSDAYGQISQIGRATGNATSAQRLISSMRAKIANLVAKAPRFSSPVTYYFEVGVDPYYAVTSQTFIGQILSMFHVRNVADAAPSAAGGYPELSSEYIVKADPDIIFLADTVCCAQTAMTVTRRPGWDEITAIRNGDVFSLNDDIASRWGPRVVDLVADIEHALTRLRDVHGA